ncbi:MAG: hypothetical protein GY756_04270 [bacterium]|nr:hypothetical protein [bacterium]
MCCKPKSNCCCTSDRNLNRQFFTKDELKDNLSSYKENLEKELAGVKEYLKKDK